MAENNVEKKTQELVGKIITDLGYELYDIEYLKEGKEYHLCIYIDKETNRSYRWDDDDTKYYCIGSDWQDIKMINGGTP